jgi:hypothetical protein
MSAPPEPSYYRLKAADIKPANCLARRLCDEDRRWSPLVYFEKQCNRRPVAVEGEGLCSGCKDVHDRETALGGTIKRWQGLITEEPLAHCRMLGTARTARYTWIGAPVAPVADATAESCLKVVEGQYYWVEGLRVFDYDQVTEKKTGFVGHLRPDDSIAWDPAVLAAKEAAAEAVKAANLASALAAAAAARAAHVVAAAAAASPVVWVDRATVDLEMRVKDETIAAQQAEIAALKASLQLVRDAVGGLTGA